MVLRPHVIIVEQGPLISGRLDTQLIEGARMLLYQFYGAVNEGDAVRASRAWPTEYPEIYPGPSEVYQLLVATMK